MMKISKEEARNFLIHYHFLDSQDLTGEAGILRYFDRVGSIQYDPLNVVGRNADLVLQSRVKGYNPDLLEHLLYEKRSLIDGWDKMMSIYKTEDWPYFSRLRMAMEHEIKNTLSYRNSLDALHLIEDVRQFIVTNGPTQSNQLHIGTSVGGSWGHKKLSSAALDYMYNRGELGIKNKRNTQKVYDLIENLLPTEILHAKDPFLTDHDYHKWLIKRRIGSVGLLWGRNGGAWLGHSLSNKDMRQTVFRELVNEGELIPIQVEDLKDLFYINKKDSETFIPSTYKNNVRFLAPLDNLLWDRLMVETLFNFNYRWEVYTPVNKRKYGYYVLPVLYNNQFIARFEPEIHRKDAPLIIKNWWWEEGVIPTEPMKIAIKDAFENFCETLGAPSIKRF